MSSDESLREKMRVSHYRNRAEKAEAEVGRLREALEQIAAMNGANVERATYASHLRSAIEIAFAALAAVSEETPQDQECADCVEESCEKYGCMKKWNAAAVSEETPKCT